MSKRNNKTEYDFEYLHHTDAAVKVREVGSGEDGMTYWLPRSQCSCDEDFGSLSVGEEFTMEVAQWLLEEKGIV